MFTMSVESNYLSPQWKSFEIYFSRLFVFSMKYLISSRICISDQADFVNNFEAFFLFGTNTLPSNFLDLSKSTRVL